MSGGVAAALLLALLVPAVAGAGGAGRGPAAITFAPATSTTDQWAFGGSFSASYSCTTTNCPDGNATVDPVLSMSENIQLKWAVIYTRTNVSASQTEFGVEAAIGASVSISLTECESGSGPSCPTVSISVSLNGHDSKSGYTNVTTGQVDLLTGSDSPGLVDALAVMNAASREAFNVSGSFSVEIVNVTTETISANYDVGGSESSQITFSTPLGVVPVSVAPGDNWTANEPFSATGSYKAGADVNEEYNGTSYSINSWKPGSATASGTLYVNGYDLGETTLTDSYVSPPKTVTVQEILLEFSDGNFSAADGWFLGSDAIYYGLYDDLDEYAPAVVPEVAALPGLSLDSTLGNESTYYTSGQGFVGAEIAGNISSLDSSVSGGPKINLQAGPEPVSVAQSQYNAIFSSSSSSGFPLLLVAAVVVVVVVVVGVVLMVRARSARRRPPAPLNPAPPLASPATPPGPPSPPGPGGA